MKYAESTTVPVEKSQAELKATLSKYGCTHFGLLEEPGGATVLFKLNELPFRIRVDLPRQDEERFLVKVHAQTKRKTDLTPEEAHKRWEQACRQTWRVILLIIKANLEATEMGIMRPEQALMPFLLTGTGKTVAEEIFPRMNDLSAKGGSVMGFLGVGKK